MTTLARTARLDLLELTAEARHSPEARLILADAYEEQGRHDVAALHRDALPERSDEVKERNCAPSSPQ